MTMFEDIIGRDLRIIMTGLNAPGFPSLAEHTKTLANFLIGTDYKRNLVGNLIADKIYITPSVTVNSTSEEKLNYVIELNKIAIENDIDYIIPIRTGDVMALVEFNNCLSKNVKSLIPTTSIDKFNILNDKLLLMRLLEEFGLNHPIYTTFKNVEEFDEKANSIISQLKSVDDKVVIKPRVQSGSRGMRIMSLTMDNDAKWDQFMNKKPAENIYMTKKQLVAIAGWTRTFDMIMMEYLPGNEYTVDCLCYDGKTKLMAIRKRLATDGGISSKAEMVFNSDAPNIFPICKKIIKNLNLSYNVGFQFKCDSNGEAKLIECNPRLQGTTCFSIEAGKDFIFGSLCIAEGLIGSLDLLNNTVWKVRYMERVYQELYSRELP